jgi:hypothetical protein
MAAREEEEEGSRERTEQPEIEPHVTGAYVAFLSRGLLCIWHEKPRHARAQDGASCDLRPLACGLCPLARPLAPPTETGGAVCPLSCVFAALHHEERARLRVQGARR